jgi:hypothetical protein
MKKIGLGFLLGIVFMLLVRLVSPVDNIQQKLELTGYNDINNSLNADKPLYLKSSYGDIEAYHPKVIYLADKWNGYSYWMVFSPYPRGDQSKENPHLLVSNDLSNWDEPNGFANPIEGQPEGNPQKQYNSDPHIVYNSDLDRIEVFWRFVDEDKGISTIYRKYSGDGVNWSKKEVVISGDKKTSDHVSPAVIFEDGIYKMWYVANGYKVWYIESKDGTHWTNPREITIPYETQLKNWHLDVIHTDLGYEMVINSFANGQDRNSMSLYYTKSDDNVVYSTAKVLLEPSKDANSWDNRGIYRSSLLKEDGKYYLFYSGISKDWVRGVGLTVFEKNEL